MFRAGLTIKGIFIVVLFQTLWKIVLGLNSAGQSFLPARAKEVR